MELESLIIGLLLGILAPYAIPKIPHAIRYVKNLFTGNTGEQTEP